MKILKVNREAHRWPAEAAAAVALADANPLDCFPVSLLADSVINRNDRPVFVPEFAREGWSMEVFPAVHIGHQGKFIAPRFASRYISGVSLTALLRPDSVPEASNPLTWMFDCALTAGPVSEGYPVAGETMEITLEYAPLGTGCAEPFEPVTLTARVTGEDLRIEETVALLSRFTTLKTGDIILPASVGLSVPVRLNTSLKAAFGERAPLITRLK